MANSVVGDARDMPPDSCDTPGIAHTTFTASEQEHARDVVRTCLAELQAASHLGPGHVVVIGASSSEVIGKRIGTATSLEVGRAIVEAVLEARDTYGFDVAFQCCEHLNRALVVAQALAKSRNWTVVRAVPVPGAGGAVTSLAYFMLEEACLVEQIEADAGIDIGDTFIGMHLKRVAVPLRGTYQALGAAHVTMAYSRAPLFGGARAVYDEAEAKRRLGIQRN